MSTSLRCSDGTQLGRSNWLCLSSASKGGRLVERSETRRSFLQVSLLAGEAAKRSPGERPSRSSRGASLNDLHRYFGMKSASSLFKSAGQLRLFAVPGSTRIDGKGSFGRVTEALLSKPSSKRTFESTSSSARFRIISRTSFVCSLVGLLRKALLLISSVFLIPL